MSRDETFKGITPEQAMALRRAGVDIFLVQHSSAIVNRGGARPDWFGAMLVRLFFKADPVNVVRLSSAFPAYGLAWMLWTAAPSPETFYRDLAIGELLHGEAAAIYAAQTRGGGGADES